MTAAVASERSLAGRRLRYDGSEWALKDRLGSGKFATVYLAERVAVLSPTGAGARHPDRLAVKVTDITAVSAWARMQLIREAHIWAELAHPHIVRLLGYVRSPTQHALLLEHVEGGELFDRIIALQVLSESTAARMLSQLLSAVAYLHAAGVAHRDLKPENILLASKSEDAPIKVADFGAAAQVSPGQGLYTPCGSMGYAAPEQISALGASSDPGFRARPQRQTSTPPSQQQGQREPRLSTQQCGKRARSVGQPSEVISAGPLPSKQPPPSGVATLSLQLIDAPASAYHFDVDMWSVGVISYILLCGAMPFDPNHYRSAPLVPAFPEELFGSVSPAATALVARMLKLDPAERITAEQALRHEWFTNQADPAAAAAAFDGAPAAAAAAISSAADAAADAELASAGDATSCDAPSCDRSTSCDSSASSSATASATAFATTFATPSLGPTASAATPFATPSLKPFEPAAWTPGQVRTAAAVVHSAVVSSVCSGIRL